MKPCYLSLVENETSFVRSKMKRIIIFMLDSHTNMHRKFSSSYRSEFIVNIELCFFLSMCTSNASFVLLRFDCFDHCENICFFELSDYTERYSST